MPAVSYKRRTIFDPQFHTASATFLNSASILASSVVSNKRKPLGLCIISPNIAAKPNVYVSHLGVKSFTATIAYLRFRYYHPGRTDVFVIFSAFWAHSKTWHVANVQEKRVAANTSVSSRLQWYNSVKIPIHIGPAWALQPMPSHYSKIHSREIYSTAFYFRTEYIFFIYVSMPFYLSLKSMTCGLRSDIIKSYFHILVYTD